MSTVSISATVGRSDQLRKQVCAPYSWLVLQHHTMTDRLIGNRYLCPESVTGRTAGGMLQLCLNTLRAGDADLRF